MLRVTGSFSLPLTLLLLTSDVIMFEGAVQNVVGTHGAPGLVLSGVIACCFGPGPVETSVCEPCSAAAVMLVKLWTQF